jgi:hypothetical protein
MEYPDLNLISYKKVSQKLNISSSPSGRLRERSKSRGTGNNHKMSYVNPPYENPISVNQNNENKNYDVITIDKTKTDSGKKIILKYKKFTINTNLKRFLVCFFI